MTSSIADVLARTRTSRRSARTPKTLVPAPGADKVLEFVSAVLQLKAGTNVLAAATANLAVWYKDGRALQVSQTIETTGFIDQAADQVTYGAGEARTDHRAYRGCENQPLVLHNLGAGEFTGNAANDALLTRPRSSLPRSTSLGNAAMADPFAALNKACLKTFGSAVSYQQGAAAPFADHRHLKKDSDEERHQDGVYARLFVNLADFATPPDHGRRGDHRRRDVHRLRSAGRSIRRRDAPLMRAAA